MSDQLPDDTRPEDDAYLDWCELNPDEFDMEDDFDGSDCENYCPHCGKEYTEFSDLGCGYCDRRSPDWGVL